MLDTVLNRLEPPAPTDGRQATNVVPSVPSSVQTANVLQGVSLLARVSLGTLFLSAATVKVPGGVAGTVAYYESLFKGSLLPPLLVTAHASMIMYVEFAIALWLLSGFRLAAAWKAAGLLLVSLAVGTVFAGKYDVASANYLYVLFCALGLLVSPWDRWVVGRAGHKTLKIGR